MVFRGLYTIVINVEAYRIFVKHGKQGAMMISTDKVKYEVLPLPSNPPRIDDIPFPIAYADNFGDAMDKAEQWCEQYDEQMFVGVWLGENLMAIFDSIDWFTK